MFDGPLRLQSPHLPAVSNPCLSGARSQHHFIVRPRSPNIILDLIARTKAAVRELDNLNYKKMKKILMVETETESTVGDIEGE